MSIFPFSSRDKHTRTAFSNRNPAYVTLSVQAGAKHRPEPGRGRRVTPVSGQITAAVARVLMGSSGTYNEEKPFTFIKMDNVRAPLN